jgi:hypothetical protein
MSYAINRHRLTFDNIFIFLIGLVLFLIAAFRPIGIDSDSNGYVKILQSLEREQYVLIEPMFRLIAFIFNYNTRALFVTYALLAVPLKMFAIFKLSKYPLFSLLTYFCLFFILHEMTQIRIGVSIGILLLSITDLHDRRFIPFLLKVLLATLFHFSAIVFLCAYLFNPYSINKRNYAIIPTVLIGLGMLRLTGTAVVDIFNVIGNILPVTDFTLKIIRNVEFQAQSDYVVNVFNYQYMSYIVIYFFCLESVEKSNSPYNIILFKIFAAGLIAFYILAPFPAVGVRISDMLCVSLVFLIPNMVNTVIERNSLSLVMATYLIFCFIGYGFFGLLNLRAVL